MQTRLLPTLHGNVLDLTHACGRGHIEARLDIIELTRPGISRCRVFCVEIKVSPQVV